MSVSAPGPVVLLLSVLFILTVSPRPAAGEQEAGKREGAVTELLNPPWTGDLDGMYKRGKIRALVVFNKMQYFPDGGRRHGTACDLLKAFEKQLNRERKSAIKMVFVPVSRDGIIPALLEGRGDLAVANLTITPERMQQVDFSDPLLENVRELLVTGPSAPPVEDLDDLAGKEVYVRPSSSHYQHLTELNRKFAAAGRRPVLIRRANEHLEDSDLLEMVNAGMLPMVIVDDHKARFWAGVFDHITVHEEIAIHTGGRIGWAFRRNSPRLKKAVNSFVKTHGKGTLAGNVVFRRHLKTNKWVRNTLSEKEQRKFHQLMPLFRKYAGQYGFDWLMIAALAYQESQLDHGRTKDGAIGVMQMLKNTARDPNIGIPDIEKPENNIHAGTKYLGLLRDRYFDDPGIDPLNQALFSFAAYNAGPARIAGLRQEASRQGFDPDAWFGNVEVIAARRTGWETVQYVSNIYKYYLAYQLIVKRMEFQESARRAALKSPATGGQASPEGDDGGTAGEEPAVASGAPVPAPGSAIRIGEETPRTKAAGGPAWLWFLGGLLLGGMLILAWRWWEHRPRPGLRRNAAGGY